MEGSPKRSGLRRAMTLTRMRADPRVGVYEKLTSALFALEPDILRMGALDGESGMRRAIVIAILLLVVASASFWSGRQMRDAAAPAAKASAPAVDAANVGASVMPYEAGTQGPLPRVSVDAANGGATSAAASAAALPPEHLPLRETLAALTEAHRAGHAAATRRLLKELTDCQRYRWSALRMDMLIAFEDTPRMQRGGQRMEQMMAQAAETVSALKAQCDGLPPDIDEALLFDVQRRAAELGDLAGQLGFALVPAVTLSRALEQMDRLVLYRELAPQFLEQALQQGSGQAVAGFMDGYEHFLGNFGPPGSKQSPMQQQAIRQMADALRPLTPLQQVLGEDLAKAWRYATLCRRVCNLSDQNRAQQALDRLRDQLDLAARSQAEDEARALYEAHFARSKRPDDVDLDALRQALGLRR